MTNKYTIFGPPGTGKTTELLNLLTQELTHTPPHSIAFVSYTRKGTYEGVERAKKQLGLKGRELPYFRTLHSLCFRYFQLSRDDMITTNHYKLFSKKTGLNCTGYYTADFSSTDDEYLHAIAMKKHNESLAVKLCQNLNADKLTFIEDQFQAMKNELGILDFDDLLVNYLNHGKPLAVKSVFIDEAQDLTVLQWKVVEKMFSNADKIIIAGDDDQAVYEWSGADVKKFLNFSRKQVVLNKSYRLPKQILNISKNITKHIRQRKDKELQSNSSDGFVDGINDLNGLQGGELILSRTNYSLKLIAEQLMKKGLPYKLKGKESVNTMLLYAIYAYKKWQNREITDSEFMRYRTQFKGANVDRSWIDVMQQPKEIINYYDRLIRLKRVTMQPVVLETFHSIKGGENDHVIVSTDISKRIDQELYTNLDSELRCLYVAVTRAKKRLSFLYNDSGRYVYPSAYYRG